ncbi:transposase, partial [Erwinia sp. AnSW2-5]|uniref:transposase n=1 Tax=Erwinia sp. AnSW2-5 TaxID=3367692 RepID=UPI003859D45E
TAPKKLDTQLSKVQYMKYTLEFKLAAVRSYLDSHAGIKATAARFVLPPTHLKRWVLLYKLHGEQALCHAQKRHYPPEFKLRVVLHTLQKGDSPAAVAALFNIPSFTTVATWVRLYQESGADALHQDNRGRYKRVKRHPRTAEQTKPLTPEEMQEELRYLRAENAYLKAMQEHLLEKKRQAQEKKPK